MLRANFLANFQAGEEIVVDVITRKKNAPKFINTFYTGVSTYFNSLGVLSRLIIQISHQRYFNRGTLDGRVQSLVHIQNVKLNIC